MSSMSEERALESCGPVFIPNDPAGWSQKRFETERRRVAKSVRHLSDESQVIESCNPIVVDDLAAWLGTGAPPSPRKIVESLRQSGQLAAISSYGKPSFRTTAPWEAVVEAAMSIHPPM